MFRSLFAVRGEVRLFVEEKHPRFFEGRDVPQVNLLLGALACVDRARLGDCSGFVLRS